MKLNPFDRYEDSKIRQAQVVYLDHENIDRHCIAEITGYAISTVRNYCSKFAYLLEEAKRIFSNEVKKIAEIVTEKVEEVKQKKGNLFYLVRFFKGNKLVFSKVGTTTQPVKTRNQQSLRYYKKKGEATDFVIDKIYDCGDIPNEAIESYFRALYIAKYPNSFKTKDRFMGVEFNLKEADKIFNNFMNGITNCA